MHSKPSRTHYFRIETNFNNGKDIFVKTSTKMRRTIMGTLILKSEKMEILPSSFDTHTRPDGSFSLNYSLLVKMQGARDVSFVPSSPFDCPGQMLFDWASPQETIETTEQTNLGEKEGLLKREVLWNWEEVAKMTDEEIFRLKNQ